MRSNVCRVGVAVLFSVAPSLLAAQESPVRATPPSAGVVEALVDSVVKASLLDQGVAGVSVVVFRGDEMLVDRAWGRSDVASGRAADPSDVFILGSGAKQFTSALLLKLVDRGGLTLTDTLGAHLSGLRRDWRGITIWQVLNHTSGLPRSVSVDRTRMGEAVSLDSILARVTQAPVEATPGTSFHYSNLGYVVLAALVEKLYGRPYADVLRDEIAGPLGLTSLRYCAEVEPGRMATGYGIDYFDGSISPGPALHSSQQLGASGICATAADLARWNRALHGGRVLSEASYRAMTTPDDVARTYGLGLIVGRAPWGGAAIAGEGRDPAGYTAENVWYPADSLSVTMLYNAFPHVVSNGAHVIAALALGRTPPALRVSKPVAGNASPATGIVGAEALRRLVGEYAMGPDAAFRVGFDEDALVLTPPGGEKTPLVHESGATFAIGGPDSGTTITFLADADGRVVGFLAKSSGSPDRRLRKVR